MKSSWKPQQMVLFNRYEEPFVTKLFSLLFVVVTNRENNVEENGKMPIELDSIRRKY